jgi:hypothetical protein
MSHSATNWAIKQKGLKPATKIVLWHLCDRYHPDNGCFPMQKTLAEDCEMSRSALNHHLDILEARGLIRREQTIDDTSKKQRPTRYFFPFDEAERTVSGNETRTERTVSGKRAKPCPENAQSRVRNPDTLNSVREPVREPVKDAREVLPILSEVLSEGVARDFIVHRKALKKPLTPRAAELIVGRLRECRDPDAVANASIMNGWQGVFPEREQAGAKPGPAPGGYDAQADRWAYIARHGTSEGWRRQA